MQQNGLFAVAALARAFLRHVLRVPHQRNGEQMRIIDTHWARQQQQRHLQDHPGCLVHGAKVADSHADLKSKNRVSLLGSLTSGALDPG